MLDETVMEKIRIFAKGNEKRIEQIVSYVEENPEVLEHFTDLSQEDFMKKPVETLKLGELSDEYIKTCRLAAAEGIVLLENDGVLPLKPETKLAVFGRVQHDYFYVGYGSGGDVKKPYAVNLIEGLQANPNIALNKELLEIYRTWCLNHVPDEGEWGTWPTHFEEMPLTDEMVKNAKNESDVALIVIGRAAGEARESLLEPGSYYLTTDELSMLDVVTSNFEKVVVVLDTGNTIDMAWVETYKSKISALLIAWQGGMESGHAVADVITGITNPSGKLTSTIARNYEDYPTSNNFGGRVFNNYVEDIFVGYRYFETFAQDKVLYPFGYGRSFSDFTINGSLSKNSSTEVRMALSVKNCGPFAGKEVVQVYYKAPQGVLGKPAIQLATFIKTALLKSGETANLALGFDTAVMASYDETGATGYKSAYVLEAGAYEIFVGSSVRDVVSVGTFMVETTQVVEQLSEAAAVAVEHGFERMVARVNADDSVQLAWEKTPKRTIDLKKRIEDEMPVEITSFNGTVHLDEVIADKISLDEFIGALSLTELEALTRGHGLMGSALGSPGNAGVFGGTLDSLIQKGVNPITTSDGPSGLRLQYEAALLPCGTALASSWNMALLEELAIHQGSELTLKGSHVLLAPGMNIMRDPLCGRNFEYFSEDPVLSGFSASAMVKGLQTHGHSACPKHFACNNQETYRNTNDSRVSERALREIYLKGFEICVKKARPKNIMTSYNKINGVWGHYHYELVQTILRGEWGYEGNIVTDWWMQPSVDPNFENVSNDAYRVRAGVDVLMPGGKSFVNPNGDGSLVKSIEAGGLTLAEAQRTAKNVLEFVLDVKTKY